MILVIISIVSSIALIAILWIISHNLYLRSVVKFYINRGIYAIDKTQSDSKPKERLMKLFFIDSRPMNLQDMHFFLFALWLYAVLSIFFSWLIKIAFAETDNDLSEQNKLISLLSIRIG